MQVHRAQWKGELQRPIDQTSATPSERRRALIYVGDRIRQYFSKSIDLVFRVIEVGGNAEQKAIGALDDGHFDSLLPDTRAQCSRLLGTVDRQAKGRPRAAQPQHARRCDRKSQPADSAPGVSGQLGDARTNRLPADVRLKVDGLRNGQPGTNIACALELQKTNPGGRAEFVALIKAP